LNNYPNTGASGGNVNGAAVLSRQDFITRVEFTKEQIRDLTASIQQISTLHQRALSSPDNSLSAQLEALVAQTQIKNQQIRDGIKALEADTIKTQDNQKSMKVTQSRQLKNDFERELKGYQQEELQYRTRYREQIARQYRIVNPEATEEEVKEASEMDWGSEGVFQTAVSVLRSSKYTMF
jgi:syntaxin 1B/2/3